MSPCKISPPAAGVQAADASTLRGSASCADPRGVLLLYLKAPFCKELFVRRRKRSLQLHVMLLPVPRTASILLLRRLLCGLQLQHACCCWHRELQWRVEKANLEMWSGFILKDKVGPLGTQEVTAALIGEHQKSKRIVVLGIKTRNFFWHAGAVSACGGSNAFFLISHDFAHTYSDFDTL